MKKTLFAFALLATAGAAQADIIPALTVGSPTLVGSLYQYTYTATLAPDQALVAGNFFTIYDFEGFAGFGALPSDFTATTAFLGVTPSRTLPFDSLNVLNLTFTFNGATINQPSDGGQGVAVELGSFNVFSRFNGLGLIDFASQGTKNNGPAQGTLIDNVGSTFGPLFGSGVPAGIPEPGSWALLIIGFGVVGVSSRRRRLTQVSA